jgi:hypothetical protein
VRRWVWGSIAVGAALATFGGTSAVASPATEASSSRFVAGFTIEKPGRVRKAASLGVTRDILYGTLPTPQSKLGQAVTQTGMRIVDGRISSEIFYWECHRVHTVALPPPEYAGRYCATDVRPSVDSPAVVLHAVEGWAREDAANPMVAGYWTLDDWPPWDSGGPAKGLLQEVRSALEAATPTYPVICGFGGSIEPIGQGEGFEHAAAENFSPQGCGMVGLYNYAVWGEQPSDGSGVDWSMSILLSEQSNALQESGWNESETPLLGIGQAWSGPFDGDQFQQGLTAAQMLEQSRAFCAAGASSLGWYAWGDSGYERGTKSPNNSKVIRQGIREGIAACGL